MARIRKLTKAPITEAVFDFKARLRPGSTADLLSGAISSLRDRYPTVEPAWLVEGAFEISSESGEASSTSTRRPNGFFLRSPDSKQVAQFRLDGFTLNRLAPYTSWEAVAPEALELWNLYREAVRPEALYRVGVRYLNHIAVPAGGIELNDVLASAPQAPGELSQQLAAFITRVIIPLPTSNTLASIVQSFNLPPVSTTSAILLDIDVFRSEELGQDKATLEPLLEQLRAFKNQAFFGCLTEPMVETLT